MVILIKKIAKIMMGEGSWGVAGCRFQVSGFRSQGAGFRFQRGERVFKLQVSGCRGFSVQP